LLATGIGLAALGLLEVHLRTPSPRRALVAGLAVAFTLATSHFVGIAVVVAAGALVIAHRIVWADAATPGRRHLGLVALPSLPLVPLYMALAADLWEGFRSRPALVRVTPSSLVSNVEFAYRELPLFWRPAVGLAVVTVLLAGPARRHRLWTVPAALVVATTAVLVATREPRTFFLLPPAAVLTLGFWLGALDRVPGPAAARARRLAAAALVAVTVAAAVRAVPLFADQRAYYGILTPGLVEGIGWLRRHTPPTATVAVTSVDDAPLGWWVEGLGHRPALPASQLQWLYLNEERTRALAADRIFGPRFPDDETLADARHAGVRYLFVAKRWDGYVPARVAAFRSGHPGLALFENADVIVIAVPGTIAGR
jgi:hypothetical protein